MNYPGDILQYNWHPDSPYYDGVDVDAEWDDEPDDEENMIMTTRREADMEVSRC